MSPWPPSDPEDQAQLREADLLIHKADALLRRHKRSDGETANEGFDELPILTDVVDETELSRRPLQPAPPPLETRETASGVESTEVIEHLLSLETEINRAISEWFANEMPQIVSRELDRFSERLRDEVVWHARATLLPDLSEQISARLSQLSKNR